MTTTLGLSLQSKSEAIVMAPETLLRIYWSVFRETLQDSETSRSHLLKVRSSNYPPGMSHSHEKGCLGLSWRVAGTQLFCGFRSKQTIEYGLRATQIQAFCWQGKSTTWLRMAGSFHSRRNRTSADLAGHSVGKANQPHGFTWLVPPTTEEIARIADLAYYKQ